MTKKISKQDIILFFGGVDRLAKALGITRQAIYQWKNTIPRACGYQIEVLSHGRLKAKNMPLTMKKHIAKEIRGKL